MAKIMQLPSAREGEELSAWGKPVFFTLPRLPLGPVATALDNHTFNPLANIHSTHYMPGIVLYIHEPKLHSNHVKY